MSDSQLLELSLRRPRQPAAPATVAGHKGRSLAFWLALFAVSVIGVAWRGLAGPAVYSESSTHASTVSRSRSKPIRDVELGERSAGVNPLRYEVDPDNVPNERTWRRIDLRYVKPSGRSLWIGLLRPLTWIDDIGAKVGDRIEFDLGEFGDSGTVEVLAIGPCPRIEPGPGAIVIAKFVHEADEDDDVVELRLAGQTKPTIVTAGHRYWSVDRADYVPVGEMEDGETVDAEIGTSTVVSVTPIDFHGLLYNVETTEHVYRVGELGTLVHNNGCARNLPRGMHITDKVGAGAARPPRHHNFPQGQYRSWFEERNFPLDRLTTAMDQGTHSALHTMGWSEKLMRKLLDAEAKAGRRLTPKEIWKIGYGHMRNQNLRDVSFLPFED